MLNTKVLTYISSFTRMSMKKHKSNVKSLIWNFFNEIPNSDRLAVCTLCKHKLSFKSTSSNLKKHMIKSHPTIKLSDDRETRSNSGQETHKSQVSPSTVVMPSSSPTIDEPEDLHHQTSSLVSSTSRTYSIPMEQSMRQTSVNTFLKRKIGVGARKGIDKVLMRLFTGDFQPFSVVEDAGFKAFVSALNPSYQLPSRRTITNSLLPAAYEEVYNEVKEEMRNVKAITLTTDCWTSRNTENYFGVTGHYITENFEAKSVLLDCSCFEGSHSSQNLADALNKVIDEWGLQQKVVLVVSDNAANITKAVKDILHLNHFGCFAHTINLIAKDSLELEEVNTILDKVKQIVGHFKRSTTSMAKFMDQQKLLQNEPRKLIQCAPTRWNSIFYMLERFTCLEQPVRTTMALLNKDFPIISNEEWEFMRELVSVLKPLENVTVFTSAEKYVTASSVIVIIDGLLDVYSRMQQKQVPHLTVSASNLLKAVIKKIFNGISHRFCNLENSNTVKPDNFAHCSNQYKYI